MGKIFKKIKILTCLSFLLISFFSSAHLSFAALVCPEGQVGSPDGNSCTTPSKINTSTYKLLAPLPCDRGSGCSGGKLTTFEVYSGGSSTKLGEYLNIIIRIVIGLCAVLSVVMVVIGGIEWMTSELISSKEAGKEKIRNALLGLLIALGAYALLNTINSDLLNSDVKIDTAIANITITDFKISGALSRDGKPINVNFNKEAYPAAKNASAKTGVDEALTLAIFAQESGSGANTGSCVPANANMTAADQTALASIVGAGNVATTHVSCSLSQGHGGAIGLTQFLPTTWLTYQDEATKLLGHKPDPWNTEDALMMTALFLKNAGGVSDPRQAACKYFGACSSGGVNYADQILAKMDSIKAQIAKGKADGTIP